MQFDEGAFGSIEVSVSDLSGRLVKVFPRMIIQSGSKVELDMIGISAGTYMLNLTKDGNTISQKISKN
jgi:hypothetical protein